MAKTELLEIRLIDMPKFFIAVLFLVTVFSCRKVEEGDYQMTYDKSFQIRAEWGTIFTHVAEITYWTDWKTFLANNQLTENEVDRITIKDVIISPLLADPISYRFIEEIKVFIFDPNKPNYRIQIASEYPEPNANAGPLYLIPGLAEIKEFMSKERVGISIEMKFRQFVGSNLDQNIHLVFDVYKK